MFKEFIFDQAYLIPLIIWGGIFLFGILIDWVLLKWSLRFFKEDQNIFLLIIGSLRGRATITSFFVGMYIALQASPLPEQVTKYGLALSITIIIYLFTKMTAEIAVNAIKTVNEEADGAYKSYSIIKNVVRITFYCIGLLIILRTLGISITPMLTALGVASLAVALALQDTLGNLFSGISVIAGKRMKPGNFIRLDSGQEGIIEDISWRSTIIRETNSNRIIVPNQKIASAIITNYSLIDQHYLVRLPVGVSYDSDLDLVSRVTIEEALKVQHELYGSDEHFEPIFRYTEFDASSINFLIIVKSPDYLQHFVLKDKLIRAIHKRYKLENIEIPFPIRNVIIKKD
jgi:small-conductance mechanosensitive channel